MIRSFENQNNLPVQRIICMLHDIELQLRTLIGNVDDGPLKSKEIISGTIGKMLSDCAHLSQTILRATYWIIIQYYNIDMILSTDHKYLYEMCRAISKCSVHPNLARRACGPVNKTGCVTTVCRFLRTGQHHFN